MTLSSELVMDQNLKILKQYEFSHNVSMEHIENLESVQSIPEFQKSN